MATASAGVALVTVVAACLALLAGSAAAQEGRSAPSASELWRRYPLEPRKAGRAPAATGARARAGGRPAGRAPAGGDSGASSPALVAGVATGSAVLAAGALMLTVRRRRRGRVAELAGAQSSPSMPEPEADASARGERATPVPVAHLPAALPPEPQATWFAEVVWQQEGRHCRFCAVAAAQDGGARAPVECSEWLDWPPLDRAGVVALDAAVGALARNLEAAGWSALEPGEAWYAKRFVWAKGAGAGERAHEHRMVRTASGPTGAPSRRAARG